MDVYGFPYADLLVARRAIEAALSIDLEEASESQQPGELYFRWYISDGPCVQIHSNSGPNLRLGGDPPQPWHPAFQILVFVHGPARESIVERFSRRCILRRVEDSRKWSSCSSEAKPI
jgi:hypothetical protein